MHLDSRTVTPLPSAAARVSATSRLPGRGSSGGSPSRRQDEQTSTVTSSGATAHSGRGIGTTDRDWLVMNALSLPR